MIFILTQLLGGSLLCIAAMTFASDTPSHSSSVYMNNTQHYRTAIRHIEGGGIGYNKGYTTLEGFFAPDPASLTMMPFLDLRGHVFDNGKLAANVGLGLRKMAGSRVYGLNTYYDYRSSQKINYNQMGFGLETLGNRWDLRINGYLPMGKKVKPICLPTFTEFSNNYMIVSQKYHFAMNGGANAELGFHFGKSRLFDFYAAAGPYYFTGKMGPHIWGGKGRLTGKYKEYVTLELSNSYDKVFHNRFQCQLTLTLPFGGQSHTKHPDDYRSYDMQNVLVSRMVQPVRREEIIVEERRKECSAAIDPTTGNPYRFIFVNNTSHSLGTYESPYPTLALAQAHSNINDVIYVFPGDGTTKGMDAGIILKYNQKFWGAGNNHALQTSQGSIIIPAQSSSAPKMTNTTGYGITLDTVNQVSGFTIANTADHGIFGTHAENIAISECTIDGSMSDHIHLEYNGARATGSFRNLVLTNGAVNALFINATTASMDCNVHNCIISNNALASIDATFANQANLNITNNTIDRNGGSSWINVNGPSMILISENSYTNHTSISSTPITITAATKPISATIRNNRISENTCSAIHCILNNTDSAQLTIDHNSISNNGSGSVGPFGAPIFIDPNGSNLGSYDIQLTDNIISGNNGAALYCFNGDFSNCNANVTGNQITNNGRGLTFANGCNRFALNATNNTISNNRDHGITTGAVTMSAADITISNNQINGNTNFADGIALSQAGTNLNLVVTNNDISNNATSGIVMYAASGIVENVTANIADNTINNNQNLDSNLTGGIDLEQYTNLSGVISNNTLLNNVGSGLYVATTDASPSVCLTLKENNSNTGYTLTNNTGIFNLAPCNVDAFNTGVITTIGTITSVQSCPNAVPCT